MKKEFIKKLWFLPKENFNNIFIKKYINNYVLEIDFTQEKLNFWNKIKSWRKTTQNFKDEENWVVLECVNRLLEKWYNPEDIILEKWFPAGHWVTKYLDILVKKDWKTFLMIECKTWWTEYEKELSNLNKNWGQLFTYFQQDTKTEYIMLYASKLNSSQNIQYENDIIKIEEHYRDAWNVEDFYNRWNKITNKNGIFEPWVKAYIFENKKLTKKDLKQLEEKDWDKIFNRFESILRTHCVSDSPNAFNKIFNLFLAKIFDEKKRDIDELDFQWKENIDDDVDFQVRLINLYQKWMKAFLEKEVEWIKNDDFRYSNSEELKEKKKKMLMFNNVFAIKEVFDKETFEDNARVLKDLVLLLSEYQIRYPWKQQHLSNFFERLLTTWLKQKSGQFFTPPPIAKFIIKSIPFKKIIENKLQNSQTVHNTNILPSMIDYAAWSGHFLTETMEEMQNIINNLDTSNYYDDIKRQVDIWKIQKYDWAAKYIYWIEKDYRLVKTAKVGCYFYGDWLAQVIYWDWLDSFSESKSYRWLLYDKDVKKENPKFDFVISNPPYSVEHFKWDIKNKNPKESFDLYENFTDNSSEIEVLFIERTAQLLKEWWIASLVLPSSILSNTWFYTKAREIILKNFDIKAITELGRNTFMKTPTTTVVLFLKKRNKSKIIELEKSLEKFFINLKDITLNWIEKSISIYVSETWKWLNFEDYKSLLEKKPNKNILNHDIFKEYENKIKWNKKVLFEKIIEKEKEKLFYFILTFTQKLVIVKTNKKLWITKDEKKKDNQEEKEFLGYDFSDRRWKEWILSIISWKIIDESTKLFDPKKSNNPNKASTYIYENFENNFSREISEDLKNNIFRTNLSELLTFDRSDFEKTISLNLKKKVKIESKWEVKKLWEITKLYQPKTITSQQIKQEWEYKVFWANWIIWYYDKFNHENEEVLITCRWATCWTINFSEKNSWITGNAMVSQSIDENVLNKKYLLNFLKNSDLSSTISWTAQPQITRTNLEDFLIPLPPKEIQQKIVDEIWELEKNEEKNLEKINNLEKKIIELYENSLNNETKTYRLSNSEIFSVWIWKRLLKSEILSKWEIPVYSANVFEPFGYVNNNLLKDFTISSVIWWIDGDWMVNHIDENKPFYPTDHCWILRVKDKSINEKFLAYFLNKQWIQIGFCRTKRASIDRIEGIKITLPSLETQKQIVAEIEVLEKKIDELKIENESIPEKKKEILTKYL